MMMMMTRRGCRDEGVGFAERSKLAVKCNKELGQLLSKLSSTCDFTTVFGRHRLFFLFRFARNFPVTVFLQTTQIKSDNADEKTRDVPFNKRESYSTRRRDSQLAFPRLNDDEESKLKQTGGK